MTDDHAERSNAPTAEERAARARRLAEVFGDVLPEQTSDDRDPDQPTGYGDAWSHLVHTDDLGPAVLAALHAPSGVYNVGAEPVRRRDVLAAFAKVAGVQRTGYLGPVLRRLAGPRMEPLSRSLRICSEHFSSQTGWAATRPTFGADWLDSWRSCVPEQTT